MPRVDVTIHPYVATVSDKRMQGTEIRYTIHEEGGPRYALSRTWDVIKNTPYNIGREIDAFLRRQQPGFYAAHHG